MFWVWPPHVGCVLEVVLSTCQVAPSTPSRTRLLSSSQLNFYVSPDASYVLLSANRVYVRRNLYCFFA